MTYTISGIVKKNIGRGRKLGFPTANIDVAENIPDGIYLARIDIDNPGVEQKKLPALVFIGAAVTYGETARNAEAYILDFNQDIYGLPVTFELLRKIRDNRKFESEDGMIRQIKDDEEKARKYFAE